MRINSKMLQEIDDLLLDIKDAARTVKYDEDELLYESEKKIDSIIKKATELRNLFNL